MYLGMNELTGWHRMAYKEEIEHPSGLADRIQLQDQNMNVRYVLAGKHVGWAALYSMIKETDEGKVRDAKEDIDTVLVFVRN